MKPGRNQLRTEKPPRWWWWLRRCLVLLLILVLVVLGVITFARPLFGPLIQQRVEAALSQHLGGSWTLGEIEDLGWSGISLLDLRQRQPAENGRIRDVTVDGMRIRWSVWSLFSGDPLRLVHGVEVFGVAIGVDPQRKWWVDPDALTPVDDAVVTNVDARVVADTLREVGDVLLRLHPKLSVRIDGRVTITGLAGGDVRGGLAVSWQRQQLRIQHVSVRQRRAGLYLNELHWHPIDGITRLDSLDARGWSLGLYGGQPLGQLTVDGQLQGDRVVLDARVRDGVMVGEWRGSIAAAIGLQSLTDADIRGSGSVTLPAPPPLEGGLSARWVLAGTVLAPELDLQLAAPEVVWVDGRVIDAQMELALRPGSLVVRDVRLADDRGWYAELPTVLAVTWQGIDSHWSWQVEGGDGDRHRLRITGDGDGIRSADIDLPALPLAVLQHFIPLAQEQEASAQVRVLLGEDNRLSLRLGIVDIFRFDAAREPLALFVNVTGDRDGIRAQLSSEVDGDVARLRGRATIDAPFSGRWQELAAIARSPLLVQLWLSDLDLTQITRLVPDLEHGRGAVSGSLRIVGSLQQPEVSGSLRLRDVHLRLGGGVPPLTRMRGEVSFEPQRIVIEHLTAEMGYAPLTLRGHYSVHPDLEHDLHISARQVLVVESPEVRLRVDADVHLRGLPRRPLLRGEVGVTDLLYSPRVSWWQLGLAAGSGGGVNDSLTQLFALHQEPWSQMTFDLRIRDGHLEPRPEVRSTVWVASTFARLPLLLDLHLRGTGAVPEPEGTISANRGQILLPFTAYQLDQAAVTFPPHNPFDPRIDASLRARMAGYDVRLQVSGTVNDPRVVVSTSPPLPPDQALILATTGLPPGDTADGQSAALAVALPFVARQLREAIFGLPDPDAGPGFIDRFRLVLDEERSESGVSSARIEFFLGNRFFLFGERDRYEDYNLGILWRRIIGGGDAENPLAGAAASRVRALPIPWEVVVEPAGSAMALTSRRLLLEARRQRRNFDASGGDLLHAADAASVMERLLRRSGHAQARVIVDPDGNESGQALRRVVLEVRPGPRWRWGERSLLGAPAGHADDLERLLIARLPAGGAFDVEAIAQLRGALVDHLRLAGYSLAATSVQLPDLDRGQLEVPVRVDITSGPRFTFAAPTVSGVGELSEALRGRLLREAEAIRNEAWLRRSAIALRARLTGILQDAGYYWARIDTQIHIPGPGDETTVPLHLHVEPGPVVSLEQIEITGLTRTSENYARRRLRLRAGEPLIMSDLQAGMDRLRSTVAMQRLRAEVDAVADEDGDGDGDAGGPANQNYPERVRLRLQAEEGPSRFFELSAGYGSYEGVRGGMRYTDTNLFGYGRHWSVGVDGSQKRYQGSTVLSDYDILGGNRSLSLTVEGGVREEPSFNQRRLRIGPDVTIPLSLRQSLRLGYRLEFSRTTDVEAPLAAEDSEDSTLRRATVDLAWVYTAMDDAWLPRQGYRLEAGLALSDPYLGASRSYLESRLRAGVVLPLLADGAVGLALHAGGITRKPLDGEDTLPIADRLFLGGANSVRSFDRDLLGPGGRGRPVGGLTALSGQAELRFPIAGDLNGAMFYDIGWLSHKPWDIADEHGDGVGLGLRYHLPVGPIRVDAAYNFGERFAAKHPWAVHFAVGFTF